MERDRTWEAEGSTSSKPDADGSSHAPGFPRGIAPEPLMSEGGGGAGRMPEAMARENDPLEAGDGLYADTGGDRDVGEASEGVERAKPPLPPGVVSSLARGDIP